eukprot:1158916-Pelagomonas_calceolata.AAC.6
MNHDAVTPMVPPRHFEAVELYCKAGHHMEASQLLVELAKQSAERRVGVAPQDHLLVRLWIAGALVTVHP